MHIKKQTSSPPLKLRLCTIQCCNQRYETSFDHLGQGRTVLISLAHTSNFIWGQTSKSNWSNTLVLQKRVLRFIHFSDKREYAIPFFVATNILPVNILFYGKCTYIDA